MMKFSKAPKLTSPGYTYNTVYIQTPKTSFIFFLIVLNLRGGDFMATLYIIYYSIYRVVPVPYIDSLTYLKIKESTKNSLIFNLFRGFPVK